MRPARGSGRRGFTLVELLVVLFVLGVLSALVVPRIEVVRFRMDASARGVASALVAAQRLAVKRQHDVVVMFDTANAALRIHEDRDNDGRLDRGEGVRVVVLDDGVRFGAGGAASLGGAASPTSFTERQSGLPALRFIRNGSASQEGTVYLTSVRAVRSGVRPEDTRAVHVARSTGRVAVLTYGSGAWRGDY